MERLARLGRGDGFNLLGMSFDNTGNLGANSWRHVAFIEQPGREPIDLGMPEITEKTIEMVGSYPTSGG